MAFHSYFPLVPKGFFSIVVYSMNNKVHSMNSDITYQAGGDCAFLCRLVVCACVKRQSFFSVFFFAYHIFGETHQHLSREL